jgi:hypothetical protein
MTRSCNGPDVFRPTGSFCCHVVREGENQCCSICRSRKSSRERFGSRLPSAWKNYRVVSCYPTWAEDFRRLNTRTPHRHRQVTTAVRHPSSSDRSWNNPAIGRRATAPPYRGRSASDHSLARRWLRFKEDACLPRRLTRSGESPRDHADHSIFDVTTERIFCSRRCNRRPCQRIT